jgi:hypothetical protein
MKKITAFMISAALLLPAFLYGAEVKKEQPEKEESKKTEQVVFIDRLDMSLNAGQFTQSTAAQAGYVAPQAQQAAKQDKAGALASLLGGDAGQEEAKPAAMTEPYVMGFTFDLMSIARSSMDPFNWDLSFSLIFGDYGNFGMEAIYYLQFLSVDEYFGGTVGLDIAFDIFPLGSSPSGFYLGPIIGGRMYMIDSDYSENDMLFAFVPGFNAGYRFILEGFVIDAEIVYGAVMTLSDTPQDIIHDFWFKLGIGGLTDNVTPEMAEANKKAANK